MGKKQTAEDVLAEATRYHYAKGSPTPTKPQTALMDAVTRKGDTK